MQEEPKTNRRRGGRRRFNTHRPNTLPNLFFCGDPHGCLDQVNEAARLYKPDAMILLGDMQLSAPLDVVLEEALHYTDVYWIPGNHDTDTDQYYDYLWRSKLGQHNLHGRVINIHGLRIAGLGGVFRGQVWMPPSPPNYLFPSGLMRRLGPFNSWRGGLARRHRTTIFPSVYDYLKNHKADILVTHEAPACHKRGFQALDDLAQAMEVRWMFHGHQHEDRTYGCDSQQGIRVRAVGYRGIVNLQGDVVIPAQLDPREAADLGSAIERQNHRLEAGEIILVRDEDGRISIMDAVEPLAPGLEPAIHQPEPMVQSMLETQARQKARSLGREVQKRAPGGRWRHPRPPKNAKSNGNGNGAPAANANSAQLRERSVENSSKEGRQNGDKPSKAS